MVLLQGLQSSSRPRIDLAGAFFMSGAILFLMFGLNLIGESLRSRSLLFAGLFLALSFSSLFLFFRQEKRAANPIMDLALLRSTPFLAANLLNIIMGAGSWGLRLRAPLRHLCTQALDTDERHDTDPPVLGLFPPPPSPAFCSGDGATGGP